MAVAINDRTLEFRHIVTAAKRKQAAKPGAQRLLGDVQSSAAAGGGERPRRSEFARNAADIGRGISATMGKLQKLAQRMQCSVPRPPLRGADQSQLPRRDRCLTTTRSK